MYVAGGKVTITKLYARDVSHIRDGIDQRIIAVLFGARQELTYGYSHYYESNPAGFTIPQTLWETVLPLMCATGRCFLRKFNRFDEHTPLQWDECEPASRRIRNEHYKTGFVAARGTGDLRRPHRPVEGPWRFRLDTVLAITKYGFV